MLAAWHGKNKLCFPADGMIQGIIRSRITGMERNDHVNLFLCLISSNVSYLEMKLVIAVFLCCLVTVGDHIGF